MGEKGVAALHAGVGLVQVGVELYGGYKAVKGARRIFVRVAAHADGNSNAVVSVFTHRPRQMGVLTRSGAEVLDEDLLVKAGLHDTELLRILGLAREGTKALSCGIRPRIVLSRSLFRPEEIAAINHRYLVANTRIISGAEAAETGAGVKYSYHQSQRFVRDTLYPGEPIRNVRIPDGMNVDEFVSRQFGSRPIPQNQHLLDARINAMLGAMEHNATRDLPAGTRIQGFIVEWVD